MSSHRVQLELRNFELPKVKSAVKITINNDDGKVCTCEIGRGGLTYKPKSKQAALYLTWEELAKILGEEYNG